MVGIRGASIPLMVSLLTGASIIIGAVVAVDSRYAHAGDFADLKSAQERSIQQNRNEVRYATDQLRKQMLEDKVFEIELVPVQKRSVVDNARLEKFKRDVTEINQKWVRPQ